MAKGVSATLFLKVFHTGSTFLLSILLARILGIDGFGIYTYAISWVTLIGVLSRLGLTDIITRETVKYHFANDWALIRGIFRFGALATLSAGLVCLVATTATVLWLNPDSTATTAPLLIAFVALPLNALMTPFTGLLTGLQRVVLAQVPVLTVRPVVFFALLAATWMAFGKSTSPTHIIIIYIAAATASLIAASMLLINTLPKAGAPAHWPRPVFQSTTWLKSGFPLILFGAMFLVNSNADILMLGTMVGPEATAIYKAATRGAELVTLSLIIMAPQLKPIIVTLHHEGSTARLQQGIMKSARIAFLGSLLTGTILLLWGDSFLALFGNEFTNGKIALTILVFANLVNVAGGPAEISLVMMNHEKLAAASLGLAVTTNVVLNFLLIPDFGLNGAATATGISILVMKTTLVSLVYRLEGINTTIFDYPFKI